MNEAAVIQIMREYLDTLFPKVCSNCNRHYATHRQYLQVTQRRGPTVSYDVEIGDWNPSQPIGTLALALCPCGTALSLSSEGMPLLTLWRLMNWGRTEAQRRGLTPEVLLNHLCDAIHKQVLAEPDQGATV